MYQYLQHTSTWHFKGINIHLPTILVSTTRLLTHYIILGLSSDSDATRLMSSSRSDKPGSIIGRGWSGCWSWSIGDRGIEKACKLAGSLFHLVSWFLLHEWHASPRKTQTNFEIYFSGYSYAMQKKKQKTVDHPHRGRSGAVPVVFVLHWPTGHEIFLVEFSMDSIGLGILGKLLSNSRLPRQKRESKGLYTL